MTIDLTMLHGRGYHERRAGLIPDRMLFQIWVRGSGDVTAIHPSKIRYRMTEGFLELHDTLGAGLVQQIERGLIGRVEISALDEPEEGE